MQREAPIGRGRKRNMEMDKRGSRALSSDV